MVLIVCNVLNSNALNSASSDTMDKHLLQKKRLVCPVYLVLSVIGTLVLLALLIYSAIHPYDRVTWLLEVMPVLIVLPLLWLTYHRYPLTPLLYTLIFIHSLVLIIGGLYTYARVPLGFEIQQWLNLRRNPYDKLGHFFQGFVPALAAHEISLRGGFIESRKLLAFVVCCIALALSAVYEMIEWFAALALGQGADEFLGTQGDQWDTQSDMLCALLGAVSGLLVFGKWQEKQIRRQNLNIVEML